VTEVLRFDPSSAPIDQIGAEPPIEPERLQLDWITERFANPPSVWFPENFGELPIRPDLKTWRPAAVLIPIVPRPEGLSLLMTQRTEHLQHHPGQISFPGGRVEEKDYSHVEAALRETEEEIGLSRNQVQVIGTLPEYRTGTGYTITPIVSILHLPFELRFDPFEVAEVFEVPLSFLMNGSHHQVRIMKLPTMSEKRKFYTMPYEDRFIWGATAGILRNLYHFLRA